MTTPILSRSQRAMQIERRSSRQWTAGIVGIRVPSQSRLGVTWNTTPELCDCPDARFRNVTCKHQLAVRIAFGRLPTAA